NLDWTERLGKAFLADQPAVLDSGQRLRKRAQAAGQLPSSSDTTGSGDGQVIAIEPSSSVTVYVPAYDPTIAYGPWPHAGYSPYAFSNVVGGAVGIVLPLWGWHRCDWHHHRIEIDHARWTHLNHGRPPVLGVGGGWARDWSHERGIGM